ncbi:MAG: 30S ribosomal protein S12 methylthiotransferase RimO [Clostridiales bacterium]|nr:30S ribosomal protein S12 methylthiotransferase RimO [Clostridiales bacterium]
MKILFISLGCDKNLVDSEYMLGGLAADGFEITDDETEADIIVINTCSFILDAREESIQAILEMSEYRRSGSCRALIVCGCLAEHYREEILKEIPEVDAVLGTGSNGFLPDAIGRVLDGQKFQSYEAPGIIDHHMEPRSISTPGHFEYLKIAEGCDKRCTYCIIPSLRGSYRSIPMEDLLAEAGTLAAQGVKELNLVAQETTLYGVDLYGEKRLHTLLRELNKTKGLKWIRLLYCYPEEIYPELIEAVRDCEKVCHYIDMPIQHCNDDILRRMGRHTDKERLTANIAALREAVPDITIRTTVICGFPGETSEQHEELMEFINETEFDRLGAFVYSREDGTPAAEFPDQVAEETAAKWRDEVMELQQEVSADINEALVDSEMEVMVEGRDTEENVIVCRSRRDAPDIDGYVFVNTERDFVTGDFIRVRITASSEYDLIGELI